ncbi:MAG: PCP reductase family protein [Acidobacteriota bacterium]|nr:PCP reductase family protein [Acidobacteriota bacterium]
MKFVCLECNTPMKLYKTAPPDAGSLDVRFECPKCMHQVAMLTNPFETQIVSSLGVRIGSGKTAGDTDTASREPGCALAETMAVEKAPTTAPEEPSPSDEELPWSKGARARLDRIPAFVRPMAVSGIEQFARDNGYRRIDEEVLDQAKERFGM